MTYKHFFQWNIPAENQFCGATDRYINIIAEWDGQLHSNDTPWISLTPVVHHFADLIAVKDWYKAKCDIEAIAQKHFAEIAKAERLAKARATLIAEGEPTGIPTLDRYTAAETELLTQQTLS